jgi:amidase
MSQTEIAFLPAVEMAARIRARDLSPIEVIDAVFGQYQALNPLVNAVVTPAYEQAREAAQEA